MRRLAVLCLCVDAVSSEIKPRLDYPAAISRMLSSAIRLRGPGAPHTDSPKLQGVSLDVYVSLQLLYLCLQLLAALHHVFVAQQNLRASTFDRTDRTWLGGAGPSCCAPVPCSLKKAAPLGPINSSISCLTQAAPARFYGKHGDLFEVFLSL